MTAAAAVVVLGLTLGAADPPWGNTDIDISPTPVLIQSFEACDSDELDEVTCESPGKCYNACANKCGDKTACKQCCQAFLSADKAFRRCEAGCTHIWDELPAP